MAAVNFDELTASFTQEQWDLSAKYHQQMKLENKIYKTVSNLQHKEKGMGDFSIMMIDGHPAAIAYINELDAFRGKFIDVTGHCDFVADSVEGLRKEGRISLEEYIGACEKNCVPPFRP